MDTNNNKRLVKVKKWARVRSNEQLTAYIAKFPNHTGKLAASMLIGETYTPNTKNLKLNVAVLTLRRRQQGHEHEPSPSPQSRKDK